MGRASNADTRISASPFAAALESTGMSRQTAHRYQAKFEFRSNRREALGCTDRDRSEAALRGVVGKRSTYRRNNAPLAA